MTANPSRLIFRPTIHVYHVRPPNSSSKTLTSLHLHLISLSSPISVLPPLRSFRHQSFFSATSRSRPFSSLSSSPERHTPNPSSSVNATSSPSGALSRPPISDVRPKIDANPPKGTRDFPPEEMRLRTWLFQNFRDVSQLFGFEEVDFPVLESEALFIRKAGEEIRDQLYCFEDRGNRRVALRPELTPSLARLVIQKGKSISLPLKWFAIGQCWRYERMTRGRRREHYQWNMDIIGVPEVTAEAELISAIVTFFKKVGITDADVGFKVSSRKLEKIPLDEVKRELASAGMSEEAIQELLEILSIKSLAMLEERLGTSGQAVGELRKLFSFAEKYGFSDWIQFDASVVRGLAYYTGIVFEGFDREGKLRAICGGGRYDRLLSTFGGDDISACGFGFGDAVIVELLKEKGLLPELGLQVDNMVCSLDPELQSAAALVASTLRGKGQSVDLVLQTKPMKWVFKRAARINAQRLILVGSSEWQNSMVAVKLLATGEQYQVKLDELE
uniref:histidine--tRNA ligase n=1 Tax=Opuntia streptacantha TaxID=393608 RepID=A0A7C8YTU3_OPUST